MPSLKLLEEFLNKIKNEEKIIKEQIFRDYFLYQTPSYLTKILYGNDGIKNCEIIKSINNGLIELRNSINNKDIPEHKNKKKVYHIVEKIVNFNIKQKDKGLKILTLKQMLQKLPITLAQVNEIRQIIYSLYREKDVTKKVYNNIMNSTKLQTKIETISMKSENIKTTDPRRLLVNLTDKINLKISDKYVALSNRSISFA